MASTAKAVVTKALGGLAFGGFVYLVGDTASDYLTFTRLRAAALQLADQDDELKQLVGQPYTTGLWYNSTLGFSHRDQVAHCTFQLLGSQRVTDIAVKAGRQQGPRSNILYNIFGPGKWTVMSCQAMVPSEGGLVAPRSLLPEHREELQQWQQQRQQQLGGVGANAAAGAAACLPGQKQQQQQDGQQQASPSKRWRLWPWGNSRDSRA
jgi:hypothetical protein